MVTQSYRALIPGTYKRFLLWKTDFQDRIRDLEDIPGGPVVKTLPSNAWDAGSIPGQEAEIPYASKSKTQNIKRCGAAWG